VHGERKITNLDEEICLERSLLLLDPQDLSLLRRDLVLRRPDRLGVQGLVATQRERLAGRSEQRVFSVDDGELTVKTRSVRI
jgi:hypothetical protein